MRGLPAVLRAESVACSLPLSPDLDGTSAQKDSWPFQSTTKTASRPVLTRPPRLASVAGQILGCKNWAWIIPRDRDNSHKDRSEGGIFMQRGISDTTGDHPIKSASVTVARIQPSLG